MPERPDVARSANGALVASHWEGPIPPASEMEVYEKLHKGSLEFFLTTLQKEMEDRRDRQRIEHAAFDRRAKRGQWAGTPERNQPLSDEVHSVLPSSRRQHEEADLGNVCESRMRI